jgi:hypothetical protein
MSERLFQYLISMIDGLAVVLFGASSIRNYYNKR